MKMKQLLAFAVFLCLAAYLSGQTTQVRIAPANKDFAHKSSLLKSTQANNVLGYTPFPNRLTFVSRKSKLKSATSLPSSYDLRTLNLVTSVKNQGTSSYAGNCWAFAQMGNIESQWLKTGYSTYNLSEQNMVSCHGFGWGYGEGGNEFIAFGYLGRNSGPVTETDDPYNLNVHTCTSGLVPVAFEPDIQFIDGSDIDLVKEYIMQYGALSISMYWSDAAYQSKTSTTYPNTYYYSGSAGTNHMVVLAGWDDTKQTKGGTGAWIVKNSWGTSWGESGYFYISYNDKEALSTVTFHPTRLEESNVTKLLLYDQLGPISTAGYDQSEAYALVKYNSESPVTIHKIGTFAASSNTVVKIDVYKKFLNNTLDSLVCSLPEKTMPNPGFYLFDTNFKVDSVFYIKVKYTSPYDNYPVPIEEKSLDSDGNVYANPTIQAVGSQWISGDGATWQACGDDTSPSVLSVNLSIRAYGSESTQSVAGFSVSKNRACVGSNITFTNTSNDNATAYEWSSGDGATPQYATTAGPHVVSYSSTGLKDVSLKVTGPNGVDSLRRVGYIDIESSLSVFPSSSSVETEAGKAFVLEAFGADSFKWTPNQYLSADTGKKVTVQTTKSITYTVTGTSGSCTGSDTVNVTIVTRPKNDDICNADTLVLGDNGTFTNVGATVQTGEPHPKEGDCNTALEWCMEGGLQNSVWFVFTPSKTTTYSFVTGGMDTQIAIYQADTCTDILSENYTLVAANDDYYSTSPYAAAISALQMTANQNYYIQIDGSGGGTTGSFTMQVSMGNVSTTEVTADSKFNLYPNPNNGEFYITLPANESKTITVSIIDFTGKVVYAKQYSTTDENTLQIDAPTLPAGIYILKAKGTDVNQSLKFIVE